LYNMHFIFEHTNVIVVPILALAFGLFPRLDNKSIKHFLIGFAIYFATVFVLGTIFNGIATHTGDDFYSANYLFMFDKAEAVDILPFVGPLFDVNFNIGVLTFYPVIQPIILIVFVAICMLVYGAIRLIYFVKDKLVKKNVEIENKQD